MAVGIALGVLVGIVSAAAFLLFLKAAFRDGDTLKAAGGLVSMPASWFGGGWLTTVFDVASILSAYVTTLAVVMVVICSYPLRTLVIRVATDIGRPA